MTEKIGPFKDAAKLKPLFKTLTSELGLLNIQIRLMLDNSLIKVKIVHVINLVIIWVAANHELLFNKEAFDLTGITKDISVLTFMDKNKNNMVALFELPSRKNPQELTFVILTADNFQLVFCLP